MGIKVIIRINNKLIKMENLFTADNKWIKHQIQQLLWHFHIVKQNLLNEELENSDKGLSTVKFKY